MKLIFRLVLFLLSITISFVVEAGTVVVIDIDGTINPAAAGFIHRSINKAAAEKAECLIIRLNTPGGLLESTRSIVGDMLKSPVPIVVYIAPAGAHAGSAGVFLTLAADVAVMSPGTNLGAAHPVDMQGQQPDTVMGEKVTNDAAAFIRSIAGRRHRNDLWAELAVRKSVSLTENEALSQHVIDIIAADRDDLLRQLDGRTLSFGAQGQQTRTLHTKDAAVTYLRMSFTEKLLDLISNPNFTYILFLLGLYGVMFELYNPGSILPGIVGVISLILAFYAMQALPVNYAGVALIIFGVALFLLELKIASHGLLAIGGIVSLLLGSLMLFRPGSSAEGLPGLSKLVIITATTVTALFFLTVIGLGLRAQGRKPVTGPAAMQGVMGECIDPLTPFGTVKVQGEYWKAESIAGPVEAGKPVRVQSVRDLVLLVEPAG